MGAELDRNDTFDSGDPGGKSPGSRLGDELRRWRQLVPVSGICAYYSTLNYICNTIDTDGAIEYHISRRLGRRLIEHFEMDVEVRGLDKLEGLKRYAVCCNHASYLDWPLVLGWFPEPVRFIAKRELLSMPMIGRFLRRRGVLIDRSRGAGAATAIMRAAKADSPFPILIFPEGTRSRDGEVKPFKKGGLNVLARAKLKLLPVALVGTHEAFAREARYIRPKSKLTMIIDDPVDPTDHDTADAAIAELEQRVRRNFYGGKTSAHRR